MDMIALMNWIERWEGRRSLAYDDKTGQTITPGSVVQGHPTIGVGFNLDAGGARAAIAALGLNFNQVYSGSQALTDGQINTLFTQTANQAVQGAQQIIPNFNSLPSDKQIVVVDMVFNLGMAGFSAFVLTIQAIKNQDWAGAAQQMQNSAWYRQVGQRGQADVALMAGRMTAAQSA